MSIYEIGPFQLNARQLLLTHGGEPVSLGPKVVETLLALAEDPGEVLSKSVLLDRIWPEGFIEEANLAQNVHVVRKAFHNHGVCDPIETVPRRGYRLTVSVSRVASELGGSFVARGRRSRWLAATLGGVALVAASLSFVASHAIEPRNATPGALSDKGARFYQIGRYHWNLRTRDGVRKSLNFFEQVIDTDPGNARGYAALADANVTMGDYCYGTHLPAVYFARAREYAKKALALDPNSAEAHAALGILALHRREVPAALAELQRARTLAPTYAPAQEWYGIALVRGGLLSEGVAELKAAAALDPLSVATIAWLGKAAYLDRRFDDAVAYSRQALELSPRRIDALTTLGEAYEAKGDIIRAIAAFKRYGAVDRFYRPEAAALLAHAYALAHRTPEARAQFDYARAHARDVDPTDLAAAAQAIGGSLGTARRPGRHALRAATYA
jgi:DNA-binding winged helix-turn-helix (wHTH) protein/tetratricopeptide (TPR) repeat protein